VASQVMRHNTLQAIFWFGNVPLSYRKRSGPKYRSKPVVKLWCIPQVSHSQWVRRPGWQLEQRYRVRIPLPGN